MGKVVVTSPTANLPPGKRVNLLPPPRIQPPSVTPPADFSSSVRGKRTTNLLLSSHKLMIAGVHYYTVTTVLKCVTGYTPYS